MDKTDQIKSLVIALEDKENIIKKLGKHWFQNRSVVKKRRQTRDLQAVHARVNMTISRCWLIHTEPERTYRPEAVESYLETTAWVSNTILEPKSMQDLQNRWWDQNVILQVKHRCETLSHTFLETLSTYGYSNHETF